MIFNFSEMVRRGMVNEGDLINPYAILKKKAEQITLTKEVTGCDFAQTFEREKLKWFFAKDSKGKFIIMGSSACNLSLKGKIGYDYGISDMIQLCQSFYSDTTYGLYARPLDDQDVRHLRGRNNIPSVFEKEIGQIWIAKKCADDNGNQGLFYMDKNDVGSANLFCRYTEASFLQKFSICPVITISSPSHFMIDSDSMKQKGEWKLIPRRK